MYERRSVLSGERRLEIRASRLDVDVLLLGAAGRRRAAREDPADVVAGGGLADEVLAGLELHVGEVLGGAVDLVRASLARSRRS